MPETEAAGKNAAGKSVGKPGVYMITSEAWSARQAALKCCCRTAALPEVSARAQVLMGEELLGLKTGRTGGITACSEMRAWVQVARLQVAVADGIHCHLALKMALTAMPSVSDRPAIKSLGAPVQNSTILAAMRVPAHLKMSAA